MPTTIGHFDATIRFTGNGESSLRSSVANAYIPKSGPLDVGMSAELDGINNTGSLSDIASTDSLKLYSAFFG